MKKSTFTDFLKENPLLEHRAWVRVLACASAALALLAGVVVHAVSGNANSPKAGVCTQSAAPLK